MTKEKMNELFNDMWWLSDQKEPMKDFIQIIKDYVASMKGNVRIGLIDLYNIDEKFGHGELYVAYDHCGGCVSPEVYEAGDFIKHMQEFYNDCYEEMRPDGFWNERLEKLMKKYN